MSRFNTVFAEAVGQATLSFSRLDAFALAVLRNFIGDLDHELVSAILPRRANASNTAETLQTIAGSKYLSGIDADLAAELGAIVSRFRELTPERNWLAHGLLAGGEEGEEMLLIDHQRLGSTKETSVERVRALTADIEALTDRFAQFALRQLELIDREFALGKPGYRGFARFGQGGGAFLLGAPENTGEEAATDA